MISGTFADRYGFKKVLIVSYLAYLPSILLLIFTKSFSGIALTMLVDRPRRRHLQAARSRARCGRSPTRPTRPSASASSTPWSTSAAPSARSWPGKLRAISWDYAFIAAAVSIVVMLLITIFFYKEPPAGDRGA